MTWKARFYPSCMEGHLAPFGSARARAHARVERHWRDAISVHVAGESSDPAQLVRLVPRLRRGS